MLEQDEDMMLMDRVRQVAPSITPWNELIDMAKKNMLEKRNVLDSDDREDIKRALAVLQDQRKVSNPSDKVEQLKYVASKVGLKLSELPPNTVHLSSDAFYITVKTDSGDVFINHGSHDAEKCESLSALISKCDWKNLIVQISNINRFYPNRKDCESHARAQAFTALMLMESDLITTSRTKYQSQNVRDTCLYGNYGLCRPRESGSPMRMHIFLTPHDLVDVQTKSMLQPTNQGIFDKELGYYVELIVESSEEIQLLPAKSAIHTKSRDVDFVALGQNNGAQVKAKFCMDFREPIVMLESNVTLIENLSGFAIPDDEVSNFVCKSVEKLGFPQSSAGCSKLSLVLSDHFHSYYVDESSHEHLPCRKVSRVFFTQPNQIAPIIAIIREQLLMNTVFGSCIRPEIQRHRRSESMDYSLDLSMPKESVAEVIFESAHIELGLCSARFEFCMANRQWSVNVKRLDNGQQMKAETVTGMNIFDKSWSIPVTMRAILKESCDQSVIDASNNIKEEPSEDGSDRSHPSQNDVTTKSLAHKSCTNRAPINQSNDDSKCDSNNSKSATSNFWLSDSADHCFNTHNTIESEMCEFVGKAWRPVLEKDLLRVGLCLTPKSDAIQTSFHVDNSSLPGKPSVNLLDLFKEIEQWEELKSPELSPIKTPPPAAQIHAQRVLGTNSQDVFGTNSPGPPQLSSQPSPAPIRGSLGRAGRPSNSSDTLGDLDKLCQLLTAQTPTNDGPMRPPSMSGQSPISMEMAPSTPGSTGQPPPFERKRSIQDTIDSVVQEVTSSPGTPLGRTSPCTPGNMSTLSQSPSSSTDNRHRALMLGHSRSFDLDIMANRAGSIDEFDFEKSDPIEAGLVGGARWPTSGAGSPSMPQLPHTAGPYSTTLSQEQFPFPLPTSGPGSRGGRVRTSQSGSRRRTRRANTVNMGDRQQSASPGQIQQRKTRGATASRRVRRPRGGTMTPDTYAAQMIAQSTEVVDRVSPKVTMKINMAHLQSELGGNYDASTPLELARAKFNEAIPKSSCLNSSQSSSPSPGLIRASPSIASREGESPVGSVVKTHGLDVEDSEEDMNTKMTTQDDLLRRNMLDLAKETDNVPWNAPPNIKLIHTLHNEANSPNTGYTATPQHQDLERRSSSSSSTGNVFDNLNPTKSQETTRAKPNILAKPAGKKGSLEMVIGKLKLKDVTAAAIPLVAHPTLGEVEDAMRKSTESLESVFGGEYIPAQTTSYTPNTDSPMKRKLEQYAPNSSLPSTPNLVNDNNRAPTLFSQVETKPPVLKIKPIVDQSKSTKVIPAQPKKRPLVVDPDKDKFALLREKALKKKRALQKAEQAAKNAAPPPLKQPKIEIPTTPEKEKVGKSGSIPGFPGTDGIMFSKSLKGFKIPKVVDDSTSSKAEEAPPSAPPAPAPHIASQRSNRGPPELAVQVNQPRLPKSILKQTPNAMQGANTQPPILRPEVNMRAGLLARPQGRKTLLPIPCNSPAPVLGTAYPTASSFPPESQTPRSPDGLVIDDVARSPVAPVSTAVHEQTSPQLSIVTDDPEALALTSA